MNKQSITNNKMLLRCGPFRIHHMQVDWQPSDQLWSNRIRSDHNVTDAIHRIFNEIQT